MEIAAIHGIMPKTVCYLMKNITVSLIKINQNSSRRIKMPHKFANIHGYFDFDNLYEAITNQYPDGVYVELGSWLGKSTCYMGELIKEKNINAKFYVFDTFGGEVNAVDQQEIVKECGGSIYKQFLKNMKDADVLDCMIPLMISSLEGHELLEDKSVDFVFIDTEHTYEMIKEELDKWYPKVKDGGIIAGHDYRDGVAKGVNEFFGGLGKTVGANRSSWVVNV